MADFNNPILIENRTEQLDSVKVMQDLNTLTFQQAYNGGVIQWLLRIAMVCIPIMFSFNFLMASLSTFFREPDYNFRAIMGCIAGGLLLTGFLYMLYTYVVTLFNKKVIVFTKRGGSIYHRPFPQFFSKNISRWDIAQIYVNEDTMDLELIYIDQRKITLLDGLESHHAETLSEYARRFWNLKENCVVKGEFKWESKAEKLTDTDDLLVPVPDSIKMKPLENGVLISFWYQKSFLGKIFTSVFLVVIGIGYVITFKALLNGEIESLIALGFLSVFAYFMTLTSIGRVYIEITPLLVTYRNWPFPWKWRYLTPMIKGASVEMYFSGEDNDVKRFRVNLDLLLGTAIELKNDIETYEEALFIQHQIQTHLEIEENKDDEDEDSKD